jgi:hypothetical protein
VIGSIKGVHEILINSLYYHLILREIPNILAFFENSELCSAQIRCTMCYVCNNSNTGDGIFMKFDPGSLNCIDNTPTLVKSRLFTRRSLPFLIESEANSPDVYQEKNSSKKC